MGRAFTGSALALTVLLAVAGMAQREAGERRPDPQAICVSRGRGPRADEEVLRRLYPAFLDFYRRGDDWKAFFHPEATSTGVFPDRPVRTLTLAEADVALAQTRLLYPQMEFRILWSRAVVGEDGRSGILVFEQESRLANARGDRLRRRFVGTAYCVLVGNHWQIVRLDEYHLPTPESAPPGDGGSNPTPPRG